MDVTGSYALQIHDGLLLKEHLNGIQESQSLKVVCLEGCVLPLNIRQPTANWILP